MKIFLTILVLILAMLGVYFWVHSVQHSISSNALSDRPSVSPEATISPEMIRSTLESSNFDIPHSGGKVFLEYEKLGEDSSHGFLNEYVWLVTQEYQLKNGVLEKGDFVSTPVALSFGNQELQALSIPRQGASYIDDIQKIFPDAIKSLPVFVDSIARDELVAKLQEDAKLEAQEYFNVSSEIIPIITPEATSAPQ